MMLLLPVMFLIDNVRGDITVVISLLQYSLFFPIFIIPLNERIIL